MKKGKKDSTQVFEINSNIFREKRRRERKSRWTEQSQVVIGQQVSAAKEGPAPVPRTKEDGTKLTKAQRKKLKKKRRKEERRKEGDSGVDTGNDSAGNRINYRLFEVLVI